LHDHAAQRSALTVTPDTKGSYRSGVGQQMATRVTGVALAITLCLVSTSAVQAAPDPPGSNVILVAHRGAVGPGQPENTLAAFRQAIASGAEAIEIDLRGTRDGEVVVIHDATVDRTTNGTGAVADRTLAQLRQLDAGRGERIPTYQEVLRLVAGTGIVLLLDIKKGGVLDRQKVIRVTEQHDAVAQVIVGPRNLEDLKAFRALNPGLRTLGFVDEIEDIAPFIEGGADIIRLWPEWIYASPSLVDKVHHLGRQVWTTAGDAPGVELEKLVRLGVRGILVDQPEVMDELLAELRKDRGGGERAR
jgi:glycerophosphoryl diester phosphodiesterase